MPNVKITVLKREFDPDLAREYIHNPDIGPCDLFREGQEFIVTRKNYSSFPYTHHFCSSAWDTIQEKVYAGLQGGNFYWDHWMKDPKKLVLCCQDGIRPVVFLLETTDEEEN